MVATSKNHSSNGTRGQEASRRHPAEVVTSSGYPVASPQERLDKSGYMTDTVLDEVFENRADLSKKQARGAGMVFRGVSVGLRTLECGQRE